MRNSTEWRNNFTLQHINVWWFELRASSSNVSLERSKSSMKNITFVVKSPYFDFAVHYTGSVCEFWKPMLSTPWFDLISIRVAITWSSAPVELDEASPFLDSFPWSAWAMEGSEVSRSGCGEWTEAWVFLTYTSEDPLLFWESRVLFSLEDTLVVAYLFSTSMVAIWPVSVPFEHEDSSFVCEGERSSLRVSFCV